MTVLKRFYMPADAAPGAPPAPAAPTAPPAGAAAPAAPATPDIAALVAAAVKPLLEENAALKAAQVKAEQAEAGTAVAKATAEEQIARLRKQFGESQSKQALGLSVDRYQYASPAHREAALTNFKAECPVEAQDSGDVTATIAGKPKPVAAAFDEWFASKGAIYKAAVAQPGPGQPAPAGVDGGAQRKKFSDMSDAEFKAARAAGCKGTLTDGRNAPVYEMKSSSNPYAARRAQLMGKST